MSDNCIYPGCINMIDESYDDKFCIFHVFPGKRIYADKFIEREIKSKLINNNLNFEGYIFSKPIDFASLNDVPENQFKTKANLKNCVFYDWINFTGIKFIENTDFYGATFKGNVIFEQCQFLQSVDFSNCSFQSEVHFLGTICKEKIEFQDSKFLKNSFFEYFNCEKEANFNRAVFDELANFNHSQFKEDVFFQNTKFFGISDFQEAHFLGQAYFDKKTIFKKITDFSDAKFDKSATFESTKFNDIAEFNNVEINQRARFSNCIFSKVNFGGLKVGGKTFFRDSKFKEEASFENVHFKEESYFRNAIFEKTVKFNFSKAFSIDFENGKFKGDGSFYKFNVEKECKFQNVTTSKTLTFKKAVFNDNFIFNHSEISGSIKLILTIFKGNIFFNSNTFYPATYIIFEEIYLSEKTNFYFKSPIFIENKDFLKTSIIKFLNIQFNPHKTYFDNFKYKTNQSEIPFCIVIFRYCELKDVFFTDNNMIYFSFYKSIFDQARFISNDWPEFEKRKNIVVDELLITKSKENDKMKTKYELWGNKSFNTIASIYSRLKTASDNIKSYTEASLFYYNEFEMRRKHFFENKNRTFAFVYWLYKKIVGYGEKPLRSFISLLIFGLIIFPSIHVLTGLNIKGNTFNYDLDILNFTIFLNSKFWYDYFYAIGFSLYRVIPVGYLPFERTSMIPLGPDGLFFSFLNSFILILLLVFTGIGLKRHFKRF